MKILYITPFWPHRATMGSEIRSGQIHRALRQIGQVDTVLLQETLPLSDRAHEGKGCDILDVLPVNVFQSRSISDKCRWWLNPRADYPHGCGVPENAAARLRSIAASYDLIWFFKLRTANLFPQQYWPRSVVDIDDVPSTLERAVRKQSGSAVRRLAAYARMRVWQRQERRLGERFKILATCTTEDRDYLAGLGVRASVHVIPNGFTKPNVRPVHQPVSPPIFGFIGLYDYPPNREGVEWFIKNCWPAVKRELPNARLRLIGRGTDGANRSNAPGLESLGWVEDPSLEISTWSAMIVPIHVGAGTRLKIAEGFSKNCPIVSTSLGAYGYSVEHGRELLLADSAEAFTKACVQIVRFPDDTSAMADRAWKQFLMNWTWDAITPRIRAAAEECFAENSKLRPERATAG